MAKLSSHVIRKGKDSIIGLRTKGKSNLALSRNYVTGFTEKQNR